MAENDALGRGLAGWSLALHFFADSEHRCFATERQTQIRHQVGEGKEDG